MDFFDLGGVAGMVTLIWQGIGAYRRHQKRANLQILPLDQVRDLRTWNRPDGELLGKALTLEVMNRGDTMASRCLGRVTILAAPLGVRLVSQSFLVHWAPIPYSGTDTGEEPINIAAGPMRLDVLIAHPNAGPGCHIAVPLALQLPNGAPQVHLPPGEYRVEVVVSCDSGASARREFVVTSPQNWSELTVRQLS